MKKTGKIIVCLSSDENERIAMVARLLVRFGFARAPGDAKKIIVSSVYDLDLDSMFFLASGTFNFRESPHTTHFLFEMAMRGILVLVGAKHVPREMEFLCEIFTISDFKQSL